MDHVAIMQKSWGLTDRILGGEKQLESRWYKSKTGAWDKVSAGDTIYFKNAGEPVRISAKAKEVFQSADLTPATVKKLLVKYGHLDGIRPEEIHTYEKLFKDKKYAVFIFLKDVQRVSPFRVNKEGFGAMAAWLTVPSIRLIRLPL